MYPGGVKRPDRTELEATMLAFIVLVPMVYCFTRTVLALVGV